MADSPVTEQTKTERFTFVVTPTERADIDELGRRLERPASDAVRYVIRYALAELRRDQEGR